MSSAQAFIFGWDLLNYFYHIFQVFINHADNQQVLNVSSGDKTWRKVRLLVLEHILPVLHCSL